MVKHRIIKLTCASGFGLAVVLGSGSSVRTLDVLATDMPVSSVTPVLIAQDDATTNGGGGASDVIDPELEACKESTPESPKLEVCQIEKYAEAINSSVGSVQAFVKEEYIPELAKFGKSAAEADTSSLSAEVSINPDDALTALDEIETYVSNASQLISKEAPIEGAQGGGTLEPISEALTALGENVSSIKALINPLKGSGVVDEDLITEIQNLVNPTDVDGLDPEKTLSENANDDSPSNDSLVVGEYGNITRQAVEDSLNSYIKALGSNSESLTKEITILDGQVNSTSGGGGLWKTLLRLLLLLTIGGAAALIVLRYLSLRSKPNKRKRSEEDNVRAILTKYFKQGSSEFENSVLSVMQRHLASNSTTSQASRNAPIINYDQVINSLMTSPQFKQLIKAEVAQCVNQAVAQTSTQNAAPTQNASNRPPFSQGANPHRYPQNSSGISPDQSRESQPMSTPSGVRPQSPASIQSSVIARYNNGQLNYREAKEVVSLTSASQEAFRLAKGEAPILVPDDAHGNYWILAEGGQSYLVPKRKAHFNESSLQALASLYDYAPSSNLTSIRIIEPATVVAVGAERWQLKTKGKLTFG